MRKTPLELAAIASAAVPGLTPTGVAGLPDDAADFQSAVLTDSAGKRWRVRSPKHAEASMRLETELLVLRAFSPAIRAELPFQVPTVAGTVQQTELRTFVYNHVPGSTLGLEALVASGASVPVSIGRATAGIHDLPPSMVDAADLPSYTADQFRQRKLNELDQAATTGKIPPALLRRWEHALEDVALWKFNPCVVHGDLHEDNLLVHDGSVSSVTGWTDLRIGDPADDFAWLVAVHEQSFADVVLESYRKYRKDPVDPHLMRRAALAAEFALAQWLVRGLAADDQAMVDEAVEMLNELESDVAEHGGQPISVTAPPPPAVPPTILAAAPQIAEASAGTAGAASAAPAAIPEGGNSTGAAKDRVGESGSANEDSAAEGGTPATVGGPRVHLSNGAGHGKVTLLPVEEPAADAVASSAPTGLPASQGPAGHAPVAAPPADVASAGHAPSGHTPSGQESGAPESNSPENGASENNSPENNGPAASPDREDAPETGPASADTTALPVINQQ
ncbi:phosphotransferase [Arthrobacter sulfonylureivorans]|uniref:macrolide 2'-phosphotransferase n=1 Tax=Arthrobacter sulfonylureivorans TaxID=2486855 RepID=UPI0039E49B07